MANSKRKTQPIKKGRSKRVSGSTTQPLCIPCFVRIERCPDIYTVGQRVVLRPKQSPSSPSSSLPTNRRKSKRKVERCRDIYTAAQRVVRRPKQSPASRSSSLPTNRIKSQRNAVQDPLVRSPSRPTDPVIIDVWSLHCKEPTWRLKTAKTYGKRDLLAADTVRNNSTETLNPARQPETFRRESPKSFEADIDKDVGFAGCHSVHPDDKILTKTDMKVNKQHELLTEGLLRWAEIEKTQVTKQTTTRSELTPNVSSQSPPTKTIQMSSVEKGIVPNENHLSETSSYIRNQQPEKTNQERVSCPVSEVEIKQEPTERQVSVADPQSWMTCDRSPIYGQLKQVKVEGEGAVEEAERIIKEEPCATFHTNTADMKGHSAQVEATKVSQGDTIFSQFQGGKSGNHDYAQQVVKRSKVRNNHPRGKGSRYRDESGCRYCGKVFSGTKALRSHQENMVCCSVFTCKTCGKKFPNKISLFQHSRTHTQVKPYSCGHCGKRFARIAQLKVHLPIHNYSFNKEVCCSSCERLTLPKAKEVLNLRQKNMYICKTCGKGFRLKTDTERHHECVVCKCVFISATALSAHMKTHKVAYFECSDCGEQFPSECLKEKHSQKYHPPGSKHTCEQCGKTYSRKSGLEAHKLGHEDQWSLPPASPNRMNDFDEDVEIGRLINSLSKDEELLKPVNEEPCIFPNLEAYQVKTEGEDIPCYPFSGIKTESSDPFW